jgi:hypothetical protein
VKLMRRGVRCVKLMRRGVRCVKAHLDVPDRAKDGVQPLLHVLAQLHRLLAHLARAAGARHLGLHPIVTFQYSSTTLYQASYHIQYLFF